MPEGTVNPRTNTSIDFITPTIHFDTRINPDPADDVAKLKKRTIDTAALLSTTIKQGSTFTTLSALTKTLRNCSDYITPDCLRALYEIPRVTTTTQKYPLGIVEYTPQSYLQSDLNMFFDEYSKKQSQTTPNLDSIDGGFVSRKNLGFGYNGESDLDLEYAMALVNPMTVTLYQAGDKFEGASFNNFLDAIDASYCTFEGGDDEYFDAVSFPQSPRSDW